MARRNLRSPDQPLVVRLLLGLFEASASLRLAVLVIAGSAIVLAWATFVEKWYGTKAVSFAIYQSWWFAVLLALLGLNVLCAALIRLPWKRYQVGFLVTHAGILVLLAGCLVQRLGGIDAQMYVYEADASRTAFSSEQHFRLTVTSLDPEAADAKPEVVEIPFRSGPFNWDDYREHFFFPWQFAHRDQGVIYDEDGIQLEVLDYYADSKRVSIPRIELEVESEDSATASEAGPRRQRVALAVSEEPEAHGGILSPFGRGQRKQTDWGPAIAFWMTGEAAETEAFLQSAPEGPLGAAGQIVLFAAGETCRFSVGDFEQKPVLPLGDSGFEVRLIGPTRPWGLQLEIRSPEGSPQTMRLYADQPNANQQDYRNGIYGSYWFRPELPEGMADDDPRVAAMRRSQVPRIDLLLGHDQKLYFRQWEGGQLSRVGPWPVDGSGEWNVDGTKLAAFENTPTPLALRLERLIGGDRPAARVEPVPFETDKVKKAKGEVKMPRVQVRLTIDGNSGEFWLSPWFAVNPIMKQEQQGTVVGDDRRAEVVVTNDQIELGFQVYLHDFTRKVDPGAAMDSHYSSLVDVLDTGKNPEKLDEQILITMNEPLTTTDPETGRAYRVYQEAFGFVGKPGDWAFDRHVYREKQLYDPVQRDDLYYSVLSLNYDPGRGLKYAGCLLVIAGIVTMFYMRAYFFRRRTTETVHPGPSH